MENCYQITEQTQDEKIAMYMKLSKRRIIGMLIESNEMLARIRINPIVRGWDTPGEDRAWKDL